MLYKKLCKFLLILFVLLKSFYTFASNKGFNLCKFIKILTLKPL